MFKNTRKIYNVYKQIRGYSKHYATIDFFASCFRIINIILDIITTKIIIDAIIYNKNFIDILALIFILSSSKLIFSFLLKYFEHIIYIKKKEIEQAIILDIGRKSASIKLSQVENADTLDLKERALFVITNQGAAIRLLTSVSNFFISSSMLLITGAILFKLSKETLIVFVVLSFTNIYISYKASKIAIEFNEEIVPINRRLQYFANIVKNFSFGKEIRINRIEDYLLKQIKKYNNINYSIVNSMYSKRAKNQNINNVFNSFQQGIAYICGAILFWNKTLTVGNFVLFINSINKFYSSLTGFYGSVVEIMQMKNFLLPYINLMEIDELYYEGNDKFDSIEKVEYKNVSFLYPGTTKLALDNINLTFGKGKKIAIVGRNGSGKSTFVKLLLRLYEPTNGTIYINNKPISKYDYNDYLERVTAVFQDFKLFAFSLKENVILEGEYNKEKFNNLLKLLNIDSALKKMQIDVETPIAKQFDTSGIELSGGVGQKVAIMRSLYKEADVVVLDEPLASLDLKSENSINNYLKKIDNNITVFISHRLSTCQFCDEILVFDEGRIVQQGKHEELIKQSGIYQQMYLEQYKK